MARDELLNRVVVIRRDGRWVELARGITLEQAVEIRRLVKSAALYADVLILSMASGRSSA
jgi:hypothetical protein